MTSVQQSCKVLPLSPNSTGSVGFGGFFVLLIFALFFCRTSIELLMFSRSSTKSTCLFWPSSPPALSFLARLSSLTAVNAVVLFLLNKLLQQFPLLPYFQVSVSGRLHSLFLAYFLLFPSHLHPNSVSATPAVLWLINYKGKTFSLSNNWVWTTRK